MSRPSTFNRYLDHMLFNLPTTVAQATNVGGDLIEGNTDEMQERLKALAKGLVYMGGGHLATRAVFGVKQPDEKQAAARYLIRRALRS